MVPNLAVGLLLASDSLSDTISAAMAQRGYARLTRSQAFVMGQLTLGPCRPSELARRIDVSRQAMQQLLGPLMEMELVEIRPDPNDGRATLVHPTSFAEEFGRAASEELERAETDIAHRIGRRDLNTLRRIVEKGWGPLPPAR